MNRRGFLGAALTPVLAFGQGGQADRLRDPATAGNSRAPIGSLDNDEVVKGIEHKLKCTCGCNLDIFTCRTTDFTCQFSPALHKEVMDLRSAGKSPDEVISAFVAKHGEQILMAPPAEGFNLAGYLVPGIVIVAAGAVITAIILRRQALRQSAGPTAPHSLGPTVRPSDSPTAGDLDRLEKALTEVAD
jgi:cytochrome c-type biogenesis protein CcmH